MPVLFSVKHVLKVWPRPHLTSRRANKVQKPEKAFFGSTLAVDSSVQVARKCFLNTKGNNCNAPKPPKQHPWLMEEHEKDASSMLLRSPLTQWYSSTEEVALVAKDKGGRLSYYFTHIQFIFENFYICTPLLFPLYQRKRWRGGMRGEGEAASRERRALWEGLVLLFWTCHRPESHRMLLEYRIP